MFEYETAKVKNTIKYKQNKNKTKQNKINLRTDWLREHTKILQHNKKEPKTAMNQTKERNKSK